MQQNCIVKGIIVTVVFALIVLNVPTVPYRVGNIFFGQYGPLYNVDLAQKFYYVAAHPMIGKAAPYAFHQLSRTYFIQGHLHDALKYAQNEFLEFPEHSATYYILGLTLGYLHQEAEAINAFTRYIEYNPQSWAARNDKAWLQFRIGDLEGALETIEPTAHLENNPWVQNTYGTILLNLHEYDKARIAFYHAQVAVTHMTRDQWGVAYPGNDPEIYGSGLSQMAETIQQNIDLLNSQTTDSVNKADAF